MEEEALQATKAAIVVYRETVAPGLREEKLREIKPDLDNAYAAIQANLFEFSQNTSYGHHVLGLNARLLTIKKHIEEGDSVGSDLLDQTDNLVALAERGLDRDLKQ